jgi:hypothetical protein
MTRFHENRLLGLEVALASTSADSSALECPGLPEGRLGYPARGPAVKPHLVHHSRPHLHLQPLPSLHLLHPHPRRTQEQELE